VILQGASQNGPLPNYGLVVELPGFWHFLRFCHFNFLFEPCFQRNPIGRSVALFVSGSRMEGMKVWHARDVGHMA
jgi:hypothetical protein